jgi:hypothetical protein
MMNRLHIKTTALALAFTLTACGKMGSTAQNIAQSSLGNLGCKASQSEMWNSLQAVVENGEKYPDTNELREALLSIGKQYGQSGPLFNNYVNAFVENYQTTISGIEEKFAPQDERSWKKALAEAEVGIRVTDAHKDLQSKLQASLTKLDKAESALQAPCASEGEGEGDGGVASGGVTSPGPTTEPETTTVGKTGTAWEQLKTTQDLVVYGARKVLATAYQSCDVLSLKPMVASTPSVKGIEVTGHHPSGGLTRAIAQVADVVKTHYYIANQRLAKSSCFEVRNSPLIYDFGGKPYTSSSKPYELNMFKNTSGGQNTLGIDCSGFVFSALAVAGLKMDPSSSKPLKASLVHGIPSGAFKEPQDNGLRCLAKISVSKSTSIKSGDIAAINGHVVMLDQVGDDPFGLRLITKSSDCNSSKISYKNFDFVINQSSPSKNGIGINRYVAKDYLAESSSYRDGLTRYAVAACRAKFDLTPKLDSPNLSVVRHKKTSECKATALTEAHEDCVDSCRPL